MSVSKKLLYVIVTLAALFLSAPAHAQGYQYADIALSGQARPIAGANIAVCAPVATVTASVAANLATITLASTTAFAPQASLIVTGFQGSDSYFNGTFPILAVTPTTVVYSLVHAQSVAIGTGFVMQQGNATTSCAPLLPLFTDYTLMVSMSNPTLTDGLGNYAFALGPQQFWIQTYGPGVSTTFKPATAPCVIGASDCGSSPPESGVSSLNTLTGDLQLVGNSSIIITPLSASIIQLQAVSSLVNIEDSGAKPTGLFLGYQATGDCTATSPLIQNLSTLGFWDTIGDGIALFGCGATNTLTTPAAPTVTPMLASGPVGTGKFIADTLGTTTYTVKISACDAGDGCTVASIFTTITNGPATLGSNTVSLSGGCVRAVVTVTCTTAVQKLVSGAWVAFENTISNTSTGDFDGWQTLGTVADSTHLVYAGGMNTNITTNNVATATSSSLGTVTSKAGLHITWTHDANAPKHCAWLIAGPGVSTPVFMGCSRPNTSLVTDDSLDYWGPTDSGNLVRPLWVSSTPPTVATNDALVTTIANFVDSKTVTLASAAINSLTGASANFDNSLAVASACTNAHNNNGALYIPPSQFQTAFTIMVPTICVGGIVVRQAGSLDLEDTLTLSGPVSWIGIIDSAAPQQVQFAFPNSCNNPMYVGAGYPGISLIVGASRFNGICFAGYGNLGNPTQTLNNNGQLQLMNDDPEDNHFEYSVFATYGTSATHDYIGIGLLARGPGQDMKFSELSVLGGPSETEDTSWTPGVISTGRVNQAKFAGVSSTVRGLFWSGGDQALNWETSGYHCQGCMMPMLMTDTTFGWLSACWLNNDTGSQADIAMVNASPFQNPVTLCFSEAPGANSQTVFVPAFTGIFNKVVIQGPQLTNGIGTNLNVQQDNGLFSSTQGNGSHFAGIQTTCNAAGINSEAWIDDSPTNVLGATVTVGGGSNKVKLFCNGTVQVVSAASSPSMITAPTHVTLTDAATVLFNLGSSASGWGFVTLAGNRTLSVTNQISGAGYILNIKQDGTGSRTLTLGTGGSGGCTNWLVAGGGSGAITLTTTAGATDLLGWKYDGTNCWAVLNSNFN